MIHKAHTCTFKHAISATSSAGQLKSRISQTAATKMARAKPTFTSSQTRNCRSACAATTARRRKPQTITAWGNTTAAAPHNVERT